MSIRNRQKLRDDLSAARLLARATASQRRAVLAYLPFVATIAGKMAQQLGGIWQKDTLMLHGMWGLHSACLDYQPHWDVPFRAYTKFRIRGAMLHCVELSAKRTRSGQPQRREIGEEQETDRHARASW